jgi:hypothetical protein
MIDDDWRETFIDFIKDHKLPWHRREGHRGCTHDKAEQSVNFGRRQAIQAWSINRGTNEGIPTEEGKDIHRDLQEPCDFSHASWEGFQIRFLLIDGFGQCQRSHPPVYQLSILWHASSRPGA